MSDDDDDMDAIVQAVAQDVVDTTTNPKKFDSSTEGIGAAKQHRDIATQMEFHEKPSAFAIRTVVQLVALIVAGVVYFLLFAGPGLGFGADVFRTVVDLENYIDYFLIVCLAILLILYVTDFSYWEGFWYVVKVILLVLVGISFALSATLASKRFPGAAIAFYVLIFPAFIWLLKYALFRSTHTALFMKSMAVALLLSAVICLTVWLVWLGLNDLWWGYATKLHFFMLVNENVQFTPERVNEFMAMEYLYSGDVCPSVEECLMAWVLWAAPFLATCNAGVFAVLAFILSHSLRQTDKPVTVALKLFLALLAMAAVCLWVAASIAGAGIGISSAVQLFVAVFVMVLSGVVVSTVGFKTLTKQLGAVPLIRQLTASLLTDWFKAIFLMAFGPVLPFYFLLSFLNQQCRKYLPFGYHITQDGERKLWMTAAASGQLAVMKHWRWTSVLTKIMWVGVFYVIVNVGVAKLVTLFMSWLNDALSGLDYGWIVLVFYIVGLIMFLLPPVPGLPVYLTGGIILVKQGEPLLTYWGSVAFACGVCFSIKLLAIIMQQRVIGQGMSNSIAVRRLVGVNSISIRAIRRILEKPGLSLAKVMILIGGPDWPTSVLTGILRLSVFQMLLGSLPVFFLVVPMTMAGALLLRADLPGIWSPLSSATLAVAGLSQMVALLAAGYFISEEAEEHFEELASQPDDEEVAASDRANAEAAVVFLARTSWWADDFPIVLKFLLVLGAACMSVCVYILQAASEYAFENFAVTDTIEGKLKGNAANMILAPWGWVCIGLLGATIIILIIFGRAAKYRVNHLPADFVVPQAIRDVAERKPADKKLSKREGGSKTIAEGVAKATKRVLRADTEASLEAEAAKARKKAKKEAEKPRRKRTGSRSKREDVPLSEKPKEEEKEKEEKEMEEPKQAEPAKKRKKSRPPVPSKDGAEL